MGMLLMILAGRINRHQQDVVAETGASLVEQNEVGRRPGSFPLCGTGQGGFHCPGLLSTGSVVPSGQVIPFVVGSIPRMGQWLGTSYEPGR